MNRITKIILFYMIKVWTFIFLEKIEKNFNRKDLIFPKIRINSFFCFERGRGENVLFLSLSLVGVLTWAPKPSSNEMNFYM